MPAVTNGSILVVLSLTLAGAALADEPVRNATPAEQAVEQGSGTAALGPGAPDARGGTTNGTTNGTTIGSGADTTATPGLAVDEGTVMRPLSAQGTNRAGTLAEPRRRQLYGLNPKADDAGPGRNNAH